MEDNQYVDMEYLVSSELELAVTSDDVRGMVVVDPNGHRLGEVEDLVVDAHERRARLLSVVSGGILGMDSSERLIPVETITKVDDRVHVGGTHEKLRRLAGRKVETKVVDAAADRPHPATLRSFATAYRRYDVVPYWDSDRTRVYFHLR